jgi:hypothetical protein
MSDGKIMMALYQCFAVSLSGFSAPWSFALLGKSL